MAIATPERGTLIIAALLILALFFAGVWIDDYVETGSAPWGVLPYFATGAAAIVAVGLFLVLRRPRDR